MRPTHLTLGAYRIPVEWHDGFVCVADDGSCTVEDTGRWGECYFGPGQRIHVSTQHYDLPQNLMHEALHAVLEMSGARRVFGSTDDMETVIEAVSHGVLELMRRNKGLAEFLVDGE